MKYIRQRTMHFAGNAQDIIAVSTYCSATERFSYARWHQNIWSRLCEHLSNLAAAAAPLTHYSTLPTAYTGTTSSTSYTKASRSLWVPACDSSYLVRLVQLWAVAAVHVARARGGCRRVALSRSYAAPASRLARCRDTTGAPVQMLQVTSLLLSWRYRPSMNK